MKRKHRPTAGAAAILPPTSNAGLERIRMLWPIRFMKRYPEAIAEAEALWSQAVVGHLPVSPADLALVEQERTSLPVMWASFFSPLEDGRTGTDLALSWFRIHAPELCPGIRRIAQARGVYAECLDMGERTAVLRDLFSGEIYRLADMETQLIPKIRRWMRFYGVLVPIGDGTWSYISAFSALPGLPALPDATGPHDPTPQEFLEIARSALSQAGVDAAELDPAAPHAGLRRYCGIVFPTIGRFIRARPAPERQPIYFINSDGERIEYQDAKLALGRAAAERLVQALADAPDFVQTGEARWSWISRQHTQTHAQGETLADLQGSGARFTASASSPQRLARVLDRLTELCGERPVPQLVNVLRPWEGREDVVSAPSHGVRTVTLTTGAPQFDLDGDAARLQTPHFVLQSMRQKLSQVIPALRGVPRDLVHTPEGRAAVEEWLAMAEARGVPDAAGKSLGFLDLDPLRAELGLRTVMDGIARGLGSREISY